MRPKLREIKQLKVLSKNHSNYTALIPFKAIRKKDPESRSDNMRRPDALNENMNVQTLFMKLGTQQEFLPSLLTIFKNPGKQIRYSSPAPKQNAMNLNI